MHLVRFVARRARISWAALVVLPALLLLGSLAGIGAVSVAHADSPAPIVHWDGSLVTPGQNNDKPGGPVSMRVLVHGAGFTDPNGTIYTLRVVPGDVTTAPGGDYKTFCQNALPKVDVDVGTGNGQVTISGAKFDAAFAWPSQAATGQWSLCLYTPGEAAVGNTDDGPFTVLSPTPPTITISAATVAAGGTITVTGHSFVPPQAVHIFIGQCINCGPQLTGADVTSSGQNGTFTVSIPIPADAAPGEYKISAFSVPNQLLDVGPNGVQTLTVTAAQTTTTPVPTVVPTATPGKSGTGAGTGDNAGLIIGLAVAIIVLLAVLAGAIAYLATRRGGSAPGGYYGQPDPFAAPYHPPARPPALPDWDETQSGTTRAASPEETTDPGLRAYGPDAPTVQGNTPPRDPRR